ncbi:MAG: hypothetical protein JRI23_32255 [Deltaproteobacteria bacterium]|jgi:hypothetical protein|nr:hypothetical protein [Deltaproteobacteria bacterium]MBW2536914.1 hypothetical protein [Deltaproteobacteria bacterium]
MRHGWWVVLVAACGAPAPQPEQKPQVVVVPDAPAATPSEAIAEPVATSTPSAEPVDPHLPPRVKRPAAVACTLQSGESARYLDLRLWPGQATVMRINSGVPLSLALPAGPSLRGGFVRATGPGATVAAWLNRDDVWLYPAKAIPFGGYAIPRSNTRLKWVHALAAGPGSRVDLELEPDRLLKPIAKLRATVGCSSLALEPVEGLQVEADVGAPQYWGELPDAEIPLAATPGGDPVATLDVGQKGPRFVSVHDRRGSQVQVVFYAYRQIVFGWVESTSVTKLPSKPAVGYGHGRGSGSGSGSAGGHWVEYRCPAAVPLLVEHDQKRVTVGHLDVGTRFEVSMFFDAKAEAKEIRLSDDPWLTSVGSAKLTVRAEDLAGCAKP